MIKFNQTDNGFELIPQNGTNLSHCIQCAVLRADSSQLPVTVKGFDWDIVVQPNQDVEKIIEGLNLPTLRYKYPHNVFSYTTAGKLAGVMVACMGKEGIVRGIIQPFNVSRTWIGGKLLSHEDIIWLREEPISH